MRQLELWARSASRALVWVGGGVLLLMAVLVTLDVLTRSLFAVAFFESFEITSYAFAIAVAAAYAYALLTRSHIRVDALYTRLPRPARLLSDMASYLALAALAGLLAYHGWDTVWQSARLGATSSSALAVPLVVPQSLWAAGLSWFLIVVVLLLLRGAGLLMRGKRAEAEGLLGIAQEADDMGGRSGDRPQD